MSVCHSVVGPAFRETLELIQLVGNESSQTPVLYHHMLRAAGTSSAFSREDCTAGFVQRIGKSNGAFGIDVFMSVAGGALLVFTAFEIFPRLEIVSGNEKVLLELGRLAQESRPNVCWGPA